jgi:hypothetical protein
VCLEIGRVDHHRLWNGYLGSQAIHHAGEGPLLAPALPAAVEGLRWTIFLGRIAQAQAIAIDENYSAQHSPIIDGQLAVALGKKGSSRATCGSVGQKILLIVRSPCGG